MNHLVTLAHLGLAVLLLAGCGKEEGTKGDRPDFGSPTSTVTAYLNLQQGLGPDSISIFFTQKAVEEARKPENVGSFEILDEATDGDTATVKVRVRKPPFPMEAEMVYVLKKEGGEWKIARSGASGMMVDFEDLGATARSIQEGRLTESTADDPVEEGSGASPGEGEEPEERIERDTFEVDMPIVEDDEEGREVAKARIVLLIQALDQYKLDVGTYPSAESGLAALLGKPDGVGRDSWKGPYIEVEEVDPWGKRYRYLLDGGRPRIFSSGPDKTEGTEDDVHRD